MVFPRLMLLATGIPYKFIGGKVIDFYDYKLDYD
jgi:hypothetical protein